MAKVLRRSIDETGRAVGNWNDNQLLNSMVYKVEFPDGNTKKYAANIIAENVLAQVDPDGSHSSMMEAILDHRRSDNAVPMSKKYIAKTL